MDQIKFELTSIAGIKPKKFSNRLGTPPIIGMTDEACMTLFLRS